MSAELSAGSVIAGKYAVVRTLGEGGMGVVYEATHLRLRQRVAVKMLQKEMLGNEVLVSRFDREARAAAQLRSPHTARVMDVDVTDRGQPYLVMELLEGHDLDAELSARGRLPPDEAVDLVLQACAAMLEAHALGIVHRDLKPANLFLTRERIVKVLDFGISKTAAEGDAKLTAADSVMGTALYMSPEQVRAAGTVDGRADLWALGVILYELVTGKPPWMGTPTQLAAAIVTEDPPPRAEIPPPLWEILTRCLRRDAAERFPDVRELTRALAPHATPHGTGRMFAEALIAGRVSLPLVSLPPERGAATAPGWSQHDAPRPPPRSVLSVMLAAFAVGLVVIGGGTIAWWKLARKPAPPPPAPIVVAAPSPPPPPPPALPSATVAPEPSSPPAATATTTAKPRPKKAPAAAPTASEKKPEALPQFL